MASLVLGAAGAVIGSFFGMPGLGFMIGSALGSALEPKKGQDGPRLTDLHNQNSQYGLMIPIAYGTVRIAGNVIWLPDKVEHSHHNSGKGGGGGSNTYTYTQSMGIQICEGPILGVSRIWANKRLVWSALAESDFEFTLYNGTTSQLPHPAYEADKGVGNTPAHRGYAMFFVDDMNLEDFGNAPPSFEFEVIRTGSALIQRVNQWSPPQSHDGNGYMGGVTFDGTDFHIGNYFFGTPGSYIRSKYALDGTLLDATELTTVMNSPNPNGGGCVASQVSNSLAAFMYCPDPGNLHIRSYWAYDGAFCSPELTPPLSTPVDHIVDGVPIYSDNAIFASGGIGANTYVAKWNAPNGVPDGSILGYYNMGAGFGNGSNIDLSVDSDGTVWAFASHLGGPDVWHLDSDMNLLAYYATGTNSLQIQTGYGAATTYNGYIVTLDSNTYAHLAPLDGTFASVQMYPDTGVTPFPGGSGTISMGGGYFLTGDGVFKMNTPPTLQSVVDDVSIRAGYTVGQYLTDDLQQIVNGYVISQQADCRSCLEPLLTWYYVDAVESGPAVKFVNRGSGPDEDIPDDDLSAYIEGEDVPALMEVTRLQEVDLPRRITVSYFDKDADYQIGSQHEQRETSYSTTEQSIAFAIVATANEAKQTVGVMMYDTWAKRRKLSFSLPRKWSKLEPTDVKTGGGYTFVITKRDEGQAGVLKFDAVTTRAQIFSVAAVGAPSIGFNPPVPPTKQTTQLLMLDIPIIQDGDFPNGYYAAMAGAVKPAWAGAELDKSIDGGTTYNAIAASVTPDIIGTCSTVLGDFLGGNQTDNVNTLTVVIGAGGGELSSTTDTGLLNGANEFLVGDEVAQFKTATLTAPSTYDLTGLLRGRRGTEWAMGTHGASEHFVMLPTTVNVNGPFAELGASRKYKAVTSGSALADATAVDFTNTGVALRPYSCSQLGGGRNDVGDIILNWTRRTRIGGAWVDFVDVPLSETDERYKVVYYTDGTYSVEVSSAIASTQTWTLSAGDQVILFGGSVDPLYWTVQQMGSYSLGTIARGVT